MKAKSMMLMVLACLPVISFAQDDDMYFVPKKKSKTTQTTQAAPARQTYTPQTEEGDAYYCTGALRDVDEYNRRGQQGANDEEFTGTQRVAGTAHDTVYVVVENQSDSYLYDDFALASRLSRFHGFGYPYYSWYDPWYDPWYYDPWYYDPWYYGGYWGYHTWGWGWHYGWHDPWYYGPTWGWGGYYAWHPHGGHHYPGNLGGGGRRATGGRGYALANTSRTPQGSTRGNNGTRTGRSGTTGLSSSRGYAIGSRSAQQSGSRSQSLAGSRSSSSAGVRSQGLVGTQRDAGTTTVRGITGSSSRSTVTNSPSRSATTSSPSRSSGSTFRGTTSSSATSRSGSTFGGSRSSGGGFGGSRGGGRR